LFRNWERNFKEAKQYSLSSGIGIDEDDRKKGISTMPEKLERMCPSFELWDQWFGSKQKFNPSNVQCNSRDRDSDDGDDDQSRHSGQLDALENEADGGADAQLDDTDYTGNGGDEVGAAENFGDGGSGRHDGSGESSLHASQASPRSPGSAGERQQQLQQGSSAAQAARASQASPRSAGSAAQRQQQLQQASSAAQTAQAAVAAALSTSPSTAAKADKFDATYSVVQHKKIEMQHTIEKSRCANAIALQSRDQAFQARLLSAQQECKDQDAEAERRLRQRISYETNLTQLLVKDDSGAAQPVAIVPMSLQPNKELNAWVPLRMEAVVEKDRVVHDARQ
jgi:hypothetical protein